MFAGECMRHARCYVHRSMNRRVCLLILGCVLAPTAILGTSRPASAEPAPPPDPQVAKLLQAKAAVQSNRTIGASTDRYGHAEALVAAPVDKVVEGLSQFNRYKDLNKKFATARIINKEGDQTDLYMRYPVRIGALEIELYEVMRFTPIKANGAVRTLEARGIKGDMRRGHIVMSVRPVDATHSVLEIDVSLVPLLPAPQSYVDEELRDGALAFVNGLRDRAQPKPGPVVSLTE